jgi:hypothetical protein
MNLSNTLRAPCKSVSLPRASHRLNDLDISSIYMQMANGVFVALVVAVEHLTSQTLAEAAGHEVLAASCHLPVRSCLFSVITTWT